MKRKCKNCEMFVKGTTGGEGCVHSDAIWSNRTNACLPRDFCSNFFPPDPTCGECRWYKESTNSCFANPPPPECSLPNAYKNDLGCRFFQPNGKESAK